MDMDQKFVKRMKKRRDLDKLIGNGRKHIRKKSGHILLKTDSQSSISDDEDQVSSIRYQKSRCSSFLTYANWCLTTCLFIGSCVLIGLVLELRSELASLRKEFDTASFSQNGRSNDIAKLSQLEIHQLNGNLTQQMTNLRKLSQKVLSLEKEFVQFRQAEDLLRGVPAKLDAFRKDIDGQSKAIGELEEKLAATNHRLSAFSNEGAGLKGLKDGKDAVGNGTSVSARDFQTVLGRVALIEIFLRKLESRLIELSSNATSGVFDGKQGNMAKVVADVRKINSTLQRLQENLPDAKLTLGFGVVAKNATLSSKSLGAGVILHRDEYLKLKAQASSNGADIADLQSKVAKLMKVAADGSHFPETNATAKKKKDGAQATPLTSNTSAQPKAQGQTIGVAPSRSPDSKRVKEEN